jgi:hypothetical protein
MEADKREDSFRYSRSPSLATQPRHRTLQKARLEKGNPWQ